MQVDINLDLKAKQELVMTPQLQMAVKILQYNSLELEEFINEQAKENPLLKIVENKADNTFNSSTYSGIKKESPNYENFIAYQPQFCESLENQLFEVLSDDQLELGKFIVGNLNHQGELSLEFKEAAQIFFDSKAEKNIEKIKSIYKKIKGLDLKEALNSVNPCAEYVKADLTVKRNETGFEIISNESNNFDLQISSYYLNLLKNNSDPEVEEYLKKKYKGALWLIKSIEQRKQTIIKILRAVIDKQSDFFEYGFKQLYTMTMQEIAEQIEMHESTVSRATTNKYIQTPQGTVPFKMFFNSGIDNLSSVSIKAIIIELIKNEDKNNPLSDARIVEIFKKEYELDISRRTVAKYRKSLAIKGSRSRYKN
ncbi:RNA polymerase sigma-54 factor [Halanaerobium saccharolyticum]|uniref:RNA polymerase sigma-54 factor n=1 Tax=Halanaerobium saccharolyticum TaxID=43595 RepID=A0A4R7Z8E7_9FIRM|nr:RNA polymerase subunit sigma-54 [Halanaerobium saccharolyticum]RAK07892.1 RNA polymerase sigma-54 factor [Halanaerobium saccharolyticum]TDW04506.1 RNA polymerase sigma-54 factor [Halanaerobium saccharolyticum]TDX59842.1 RNA polymerase sigma-54 factor [Halanaerobium saccharolyticum]